MVTIRVPLFRLLDQSRHSSVSCPSGLSPGRIWSPKCDLVLALPLASHTQWGSPGAQSGPLMSHMTLGTGHCTVPVVSKLDLSLLICAKGLGSNMITPNISAPFLVTLQGLWCLCKCYLTTDGFFYFSYSCYRIYTTLAVRLGWEPMACCPAQFRTRWSRWPGRSRELWMSS